MGGVHVEPGVGEEVEVEREVERAAARKHDFPRARRQGVRADERPRSREAEARAQQARDELGAVGRVGAQFGVGPRGRERQARLGFGGHRVLRRRRALPLPEEVGFRVAPFLVREQAVVVEGLADLRAADLVLDGSAICAEGVDCALAREAEGDDVDLPARIGARRRVDGQSVIAPVAPDHVRVAVEWMREEVLRRIPEVEEVVARRGDGAGRFVRLVVDNVALAHVGRARMGDAAVDVEAQARGGAQRLGLLSVRHTHVAEVDEGAAVRRRRVQRGIRVLHRRAACERGRRRRRRQMEGLAVVVRAVAAVPPLRDARRAVRHERGGRRRVEPAERIGGGLRVVAAHDGVHEAHVPLLHLDHQARPGKTPDEQRPRALLHEPRRRVCKRDLAHGHRPLRHGDFRRGGQEAQLAVVPHPSLGGGAPLAEERCVVLPPFGQGERVRVEEDFRDLDAAEPVRPFGHGEVRDGVVACGSQIRVHADRDDVEAAREVALHLERLGLVVDADLAGAHWHRGVVVAVLLVEERPFRLAEEQALVLTKRAAHELRADALRRLVAEDDEQLPHVPQRLRKPQRSRRALLRGRVRGIGTEVHHRLPRRGVGDDGGGRHGLKAREGRHGGGGNRRARHRAPRAHLALPVELEGVRGRGVEVDGRAGNERGRVAARPPVERDRPVVEGEVRLAAGRIADVERASRRRVHVAASVVLAVHLEEPFAEGMLQRRRRARGHAEAHAPGELHAVDGRGPRRVGEELHDGTGAGLPGGRDGPGAQVARGVADEERTAEVRVPDVELGLGSAHEGVQREDHLVAPVFLRPGIVDDLQPLRVARQRDDEVRRGEVEAVGDRGHDARLPVGRRLPAHGALLRGNPRGRLSLRALHAQRPCRARKHACHFASRSRPSLHGSPPR